MKAAPWCPIPNALVTPPHCVCGILLSLVRWFPQIQRWVPSELSTLYLLPPQPPLGPVKGHISMSLLCMSSEAAAKLQCCLQTQASSGGPRVSTLRVPSLVARGLCCWPCRCLAGFSLSDRGWRRTGRGLAVSGSSPDTRAVCGALITLMWGLGRRSFAQRKDAMRARGASGTTEEAGEQQHLGASIIYKMPAATKAKRDQNQENRIA